MSDLRCPVCHESTPPPRQEIHSDNGYDLVRCMTCRVLYTDAREAPASSELYPAFSQSADGVAAASGRAASAFLRRRVKVATRAATSGRSLDYGTGNGDFARAMRKAGFYSVGVEPFSLGDPTTEQGLTLLSAPLAQVARTLGRFDVITLWHVFEHLDDPVSVLWQLGPLLSTNGAVVISVPNEKSWQRKLFPTSWFHLDPPRHLVHFSPATLAETLRRSGMRVVSSHPFLPEYGTSGWVQSTLNKVLPHHNFLYELVKDRGALARMSRPSFAAHLVVSVVLGAPIFVLAWPVEWLAARFNAAAAITVIARPSQPAPPTA